MRIVIECDAPSDLVDPEHRTGLTEQGHEFATEALMELGFENIQIVQSIGSRWRERTADEVGP